MKFLTQFRSFKYYLCIFSGLFTVMATTAQDSSFAAGGQSALWYEETWIWVAGAAVSILVIIALIRRGTSRK